jgi:hypothetical protein
LRYTTALWYWCRVCCCRCHFHSTHSAYQNDLAISPNTLRGRIAAKLFAKRTRRSNRRALTNGRNSSASKNFKVGIPPAAISIPTLLSPYYYYLQYSLLFAPGLLSPNFYWLLWFSYYCTYLRFFLRPSTYLNFIEINIDDNFHNAWLYMLRIMTVLYCHYLMILHY